MTRFAFNIGLTYFLLLQSVVLGAAVPNINTDLDPLYPNVKDALIMIRTPSGKASGFAVRMDGRVYIVTNVHVVLGADRITLLTIDGNTIPFKGIEYAQDDDLARLLPDWPTNRFALDISATPPTINQKVVVYGNSQGKEVTTALNGHILGIGPRLLEVDAGFVQGNSGSPIIDSQTGKVVGVATYATYSPREIDWVVDSTRFAQVRRFGVRLANTKWLTVDSKAIRDQHCLLSDIDEYLADCFAILRSFRHFENPDFFDNYKSDKVGVRYNTSLFPKRIENLCDLYVTATMPYPVSLRKVSPQSFANQDFQKNLMVMRNRCHEAFLELPKVVEDKINNTQWSIGYLNDEAHNRMPLVKYLGECTLLEIENIKKLENWRNKDHYVNLTHFKRKPILRVSPEDNK